MNYYEINKECIKKYKSKLYELLYEKEQKDIQENVETIESAKAKDGTELLKVTTGGKEYRLNSLYRPEEEAKKWVEQYNFYNYQTVITMFGLGNGIFATSIMKNLKEDDNLLIFEPSLAIFNYVLEHFDLTSLLKHESVNIYIKSVNEQMFPIFLKSNLNVANYKNLIFCHHPQYNFMYPAIYEEYLRNIIESKRQIKVNINTGSHFSRRYITNNLTNLKFLKGSISFYDLKEHIPNHVPAVIIAAGPSVEENIEGLKRMKGRAVLFAVDRILGYLLDCGIEPDFVVSLDPLKNVAHFHNHTDIKVPLICYGDSNPDILNRQQGIKIIATKHKFTEEFYKRANKAIPELLPSGSVAIVAFNAAISLGFKRMILVGQDLAYNKNKSHSGHINGSSPFQQDILVEGINGEMIKSRTDWNLYVEMYKDIIHLTPNIEVIDAKLEGAKIPGTIPMPLEEAIEKYCKEKITLNREDIENIQGFTEEEWKVVYNYIMEMPKALLEIKIVVDKGIKVCKELLDLYRKRKLDSYKIDKGMKKLKKMNQFLGEHPIYDLLDRNVSGIVAEELSGAYQFTEEADKNEVKIIEKSQIVYEATLKTIEFVTPLLKEAVNNVGQ